MADNKDAFFEVWAKESPATMKAFMGFTGDLMKNSGLDEKTFQLIYMAIQATRGGLGSVAAHAGFAKKAGATRDEVKGAILLTLMTSGINGVADCLPVAVQGFSDIAFVGFGGEPFTEYGEQMRAAAPGSFVLATCLTNGSMGYLPTKEAFDEGGYEARSSRFTGSLPGDLLGAAKELFKKYDVK